MCLRPSIEMMINCMAEMLKTNWYLDLRVHIIGVLKLVKSWRWKIFTARCDRGTGTVLSHLEGSKWIFMEWHTELSVPVLYRTSTNMCTVHSETFISWWLLSSKIISILLIVPSRTYVISIWCICTSTVKDCENIGSP